MGLSRISNSFYSLLKLSAISRGSRQTRTLFTSSSLSHEDDKIANTSEQNDLPNKSTPSRSELIKLPNEESEGPKEIVFQEIVRKQCPEPIYTLEQGVGADIDLPRLANYCFKYQALFDNHSLFEYSMRGVDNADSVIYCAPEQTDLLVVGSGLVGSAAAYYAKKIVSRMGDVLVIDKDPYSPHNTTALCNGLISSQSKSIDISRVSTLSKELIRNLRNDILVTTEDFAQIKYRPVTHLILWPEAEVDEVLKSVEQQIADGLYTDAKLPDELEKSFPWLRAVDTDIALGTHGNQDEALIDPIGLRNLYRTLAQAHGANFLKAEVIDFNTFFSRRSNEIMDISASNVIYRIPATGELRNLGFSSAILSLGHNTPFLEAKSDMEDFMRDSYGDLHFIQPRLRIHFSFSSMDTPVINFPVITDTDGSILFRDAYCGDFKYYLNYEESENFLDIDHQLFMRFDEEEPYPNLMHKSDIFANYFRDVIKDRLVKRIPAMADASFNLAYSGFESHNTVDGIPVAGQHPFHRTVLLSSGYGSRMAMYGPLMGAGLSELFMEEEEEIYDMSRFYWNRIIGNKKMSEFASLIA